MATLTQEWTSASRSEIPGELYPGPGWAGVGREYQRVTLCSTGFEVWTDNSSFGNCIITVPSPSSSYLLSLSPSSALYPFWGCWGSAFRIDSHCGRLFLLVIYRAAGSLDRGFWRIRSCSDIFCVLSAQKEYWCTDHLVSHLFSPFLQYVGGVYI